ncbi:S-adenosylmethionine-tRNA ribosyltransferase-isomerase [Candidatus Hepatincola sp. Av]
MKNLTLDTFNFNLPPNLIAQEPLANKSSAKLLHVASNCYTSYLVQDLTKLLNRHDLLIFNNTKVIPAKLVGKKGSATLSINLHKQLDNKHWLAFIKNARRLKINDVITFHQDFQCKVIEKYETGEVKLYFNYDNLYEKLDKFGFMPLPPYIKRSHINNSNDYTNYQSMFAKIEGAVASPTASLHFDQPLIDALCNKGVNHTFITLHVGAGTFLPVKVNDITQHQMHEEYGELSENTINKIQQAQTNGGRIITVGTTSLRVLEYVQLKYGKLQPFAGNINLFAYPSFNFQIVDCLITNFHLPKSTLFMLVSAFCGLTNMQKAYQYAINNHYRFFSYGDCCFLEKHLNN